MWIWRGWSAFNIEHNPIQSASLQLTPLPPSLHLLRLHTGHFGSFSLSYYNLGATQTTFQPLPLKQTIFSLVSTESRRHFNPFTFHSKSLTYIGLVNFFSILFSGFIYRFVQLRSTASEYTFYTDQILSSLCDTHF